MSLFSDGLSFVDDFVANSSNELNESISGASNRSQVSALDQAGNDATDRVQKPAFDRLESNPVVNMGVDTLNEAVTTLSQQLLINGTKKLENAANEAVGFPIRKTVQNTTDVVYTAIGLASTAQVEVLMELARSNARLIIEQIEAKNELIKELEAEIKALNNAVMIILNSQPFFTAYFDDLIKAFFLIRGANTSLKSVVSVLRSVKRFSTFGYNKAIDDLEKALALILPDRSEELAERGVTADDIRLDTFLLETIGRPENEEALAAALAIPGISAKIGELLALYTLRTLAINGLIILFLNSLDEFIKAYERNDNIDQATINHITAATDQLDKLLADMKVILFPTDGREKSVRYPAEVTTSATAWGIRLAPIIEWLKINPGKASQELDITGESVKRYLKSVEDLKKIGNQVVGLAELPAKEAQEDIKKVPTIIGKLLLRANTVLAANTINVKNVAGTGIDLDTTTTPFLIRQQFVQANDFMRAARQLDNKIEAALEPFINTPFELLEGADRVVNQMVGIMDDIGFDRGADLLRKADIKGFYESNSKTLTYVGAGAAGLGLIIKGLGDPTAESEVTDQEFEKVSELKSELDRKSDVKQVEASRSGAATKEAFINDKKVEHERNEKLGREAKLVAQKHDPDIKDSPIDNVKSTVGKALGDKFNFKEGPLSQLDPVRKRLPF